MRAGLTASTPTPLSTPLDLDLIVMNLAGTAVRDEGVVLYSLLRVAHDHDLDMDPSAVSERLGRDKALLFSELLEAAGRDRSKGFDLAREFQAHISRSYARRPPMPTPHARRVVEELEHRGVQVAFSTEFTRSTAELILAELGWSDHLMVAVDEVSMGRPAPDLLLEVLRRAGIDRPDRVGLAGDTPGDLIAGARVGCGVVVGVGCGSSNLPELARHPHTHLIEDLGELQAALGSPRTASARAIRGSASTSAPLEG